MNPNQVSKISVSSGIEDVDLYWEDLDRYWQNPMMKRQSKPNDSNPRHTTVRRRRVRRAQRAGAAIVSAMVVR